jgi:hypothetical protein
MRYAKIGPITITSSHEPTDKLDLTVNQGEARTPQLNIITPNGETEKTRSFTLRMPNYQFKQLQGLATQRQPVFIDTSMTLTDNEHPQHKGWVLLSGVNMADHLGPNYVKAEITYIPINHNPNTYLNMSYTSGNNDGTQIEHGYTDTSLNTILAEEFTSYDTNTWYDTVTPSNYTGVATTPIDGAMNFIGASSSDGSWTSCVMTSKTAYTPPFTLETSLIWESTPTGYDHALNFQLMPIRATNRSEYYSVDFLRLSINLRHDNAYYHVAKSLKGTEIEIKPYTILGVSQTTPCFKVDVTAGGLFTIYTDLGCTGTPTLLYGPANVGLDVSNGLYVGYDGANMDSTSGTTKTSYLNIYNYGESDCPNVVALPSDSTPNQTASFYRGSIPCYVTPSDQIFFTTTPSNFYNGSVKVYNSNNADSTPRQVFGTDDVFTDSSVTIDNDLVKLTTDSDGVIFSYATAGTWVDLNEFKPGETITTVEVDMNSPEMARMQVNQTYWTMQRGKPFVRVSHPYDDLTYTKKTCYLHDGSTTTTPADDSSISMTSNFYCNIWNCGTGTCATPNPSDDMRLLVLQKEPTTIKSDKIPMCSDTGIGVFNSSTPSSDPDGYLFIAREFFKDVKQQVKIIKP